MVAEGMLWGLECFRAFWGLARVIGVYLTGRLHSAAQGRAGPCGKSRDIPRFSWRFMVRYE